MKYVIFIPDGSSDYPIDELDGMTPLMEADTPNIDKMAKAGFGGLTNNVPDAYTPGSDVANMSIFGFNPADYYTGRGPLEAGSMGIETTDKDVIFRCNTITQKDNHMDDFKGRFYSGVSYRHLFVYSCDSAEDAKLLAGLKTMPPHDIAGEDLNENTSGDRWDEKLPDFIKKIMWESREVLENHEVNKKRVADGKKPANMVWLWGQGVTPTLPNFKDVYGLDAAVITGVDLLKGIGAFAGFDIIDVPGATGYFDTDYEAKGKYAIEALKNHDVVFVHIEAPDEAGHASDTAEKVRAIEQIDKHIVGPVLDSLKGQDFKAAILPDHPTPVSVGTHTRDDVPLIIYSSDKTGDESVSFDEQGVLKGSLDKKEGYKLMSRLINDDF